MAERRPIIVIKKKVGHGGHHGGAWKVAYADFVTAMMALFIVLWLLNSSEKVKKAVAGYFQDPKSSQKETGTQVAGDDENIPIDQKNVENLKAQIEKAIREQKNLDKLSKQIEITITPEGLRIELIEDKNGTFFKSGSAQLSDSGQQLLAMLAGQLKSLPNHLLIEGHTDAQQYSSDKGYTNWELSADRANAARRLLQADGVRQDQVSQVRGYADQMLRVKNNPLDPSNRRVSLIVQWMPANGLPPIKLVSDTSKPATGGETKSAAMTSSSGAVAGKTGAPASPAGEAKTSAGKPGTGKPSAGKPATGKTSLLGSLESIMPRHKGK
uniref:Chemotaxis protein MotB (Motility protein B) n=1 Tax=mine drainage metagenome TaxID=410659 RepID=E6QLP4_9ZZZZ